MRNGIKALTFDVGVSIFDWQTATRQAVRGIAEARGVNVDDGAFTMTWRRRMFQELAKVRSGQLPWQNADQLHRAVWMSWPTPTRTSNCPQRTVTN